MSLIVAPGGGLIVAPGGNQGGCQKSRDGYILGGRLHRFSVDRRLKMHADNGAQDMKVQLRGLRTHTHPSTTQTWAVLAQALCCTICALAMQKLLHILRHKCLCIVAPHKRANLLAGPAACWVLTVACLQAQPCIQSNTPRRTTGGRSCIRLSVTTVAVRLWNLGDRVPRQVLSLGAVSASPSPSRPRRVPGGSSSGFYRREPT